MRADSVTGTIDTVASICQVLMVAALCLLKNRERKPLRVTPYLISTILCCVLYFASWALYYMGIAHWGVILGLVTPPCLAFLFFAMERKNGIAMVPIGVFVICHLIYGTVNFII